MIDLDSVKDITFNNKTVIKLEDETGIIWQRGFVRFKGGYGSNWKILQTTFSNKDWGDWGTTAGSPSNIWSDGTDLYWTVTDGLTGTQKNCKFNGLKWVEIEPWNLNISGYGVWTDGTDIYYSWTTPTNTNYIFNKSTKTWSVQSTNLYVDADDIWTDGTNIYYSNGTNHYQFDKTTKTWSPKTWNGLTNFYGRFVWRDLTNIYYSYDVDNAQYVLDITNSTWTAKTWYEIDEEGDPWPIANLFNGSAIFSWANDLYAIWYDPHNSGLFSKLDKFDRLRNAWVEVNPTTEFPGSGPVWANDTQIAQKFWNFNGRCNKNETCKTKRNN